MGCVLTVTAAVLSARDEDVLKYEFENVGHAVVLDFLVVTRRAPREALGEINLCLIKLSFSD